MRTFLRFSVLGAFVAVGVLLAQRYPEAATDGDVIASAVFLGVVLCALIFGSSWGGGPRLRETVTNIAIWVTAFLMLVFAYDNRVALRYAALSTWSAFQPGTPVALSATETVLSKARNGHFTAHAAVNGARIHMLVDTGSTDIALPFDEVSRLGLDPARLDFTRTVITANGRAMVAPVLLEEVVVGGVVLRNVQASVAEPGRLSGALLGMSFLGRLSEFSFRGDKLILKQ